MNTVKNILNNRDWHPYQDETGAYDGPGLCHGWFSKPKPAPPSKEQKDNWKAQSELARSQIAISERQADLSERHLGLYEKYSERQAGIAERQADIAEQTYQLGREQWNMYKQHYNEFVAPRAREGLRQLRDLTKRVENWASPGRINYEEGQAGIRARTAFDSARKGLANTLNRFGGNMGRFTGALRSLALGSASAQAGARNTARQGILDRDLTNRFNLANMWQGAQTPLSGMDAIRTGVAGYSAANAGLSGAAGTLGGAYNGLNAAAGTLRGAAATYGTVGGQMTSHWNNANAAAAQQAGGLWGGLGSLAGNLGAAWILRPPAPSGAWGFSDRRLKTDVQKIDTLPNDINLYEYRYIGSDILYTGVMADELERVKPHLVARHQDILFVNYYELIDELIADAMSDETVVRVAKGMKPLAEAC